MPRPVFDALIPYPQRLYRGVNAPTDREIFRVVGVGPAWHVVRALRNNAALSLSPETLKALRANLESCNPLGRQVAPIPVADPHTALLASFDVSAEILANHLGTAEHIYWEEPTQSPSASRYLESTTGNPRVAILYAYGIDIDSALGPGPISFYRKQPNDTPGVALLDAGPPTTLERLFPASPHAAEVGRRIQRDSEVLIHGCVVRVTTPIVDLPPFDIRAPDASLDEAARSLVAARIAPA